MKEYLRKVWPVLLPVVCLIAGVIAIVFFCVGPWGKGKYDILAIGVVLLALSLVVIVFDIVTLIKERKK